VHFLGYRPSDQLARYYRHAIASVASSRGYETFGFTLIESFSHGTPVLARRIGSFPELIEQSGGGRLFDTSDGLRQLVAELAASPDTRRELGERGRESRVRRWSETAVVPQYEALMEQLKPSR